MLSKPPGLSLHIFSTQTKDKLALTNLTGLGILIHARFTGDAVANKRGQLVKAEKPIRPASGFIGVSPKALQQVPC
ncbi:MAG: hypothetical protein QF593_06285, partial [Nitrospinota bacterium]|nr:hypothetical protein [Nitrospinota bacterium]